MMKAVYAEAGLCVVKDVPVPKPGPGEVLIKVEAAGVNRADCVQRAGQYPPPPGSPDILGMEFVGRVHEVGLEVTRPIGSRVMGIVGGGGYAEYVVAKDKVLMRCPDTWASASGGMESASAAQLCAVPETWMTAYQLLVYVGKAQRGDVVVIHAGASNVGVAAIQMAVKVVGAIPLVTCSESKIDGALGVGAVAAIDRKAMGGQWIAPVKAAANKARVEMGLPEKDGVELVLDPVGGDYAEQNCEVLAVDGRWVLYGLMGGAEPKGSLFGHVLRKRLQILGTTIRARSADYKAEIASKIDMDVLPLLARGELKAPVHSVMPLSHAEDALNLMLKDQSFGKIVLLPGASCGAGEGPKL